MFVIRICSNSMHCLGKILSLQNEHFTNRHSFTNLQICSARNTVTDDFVIYSFIAMLFSNVVLKRTNFVRFENISDIAFRTSI